MTQIRDALIEFNPWWKKQYKLDFKPRESYQKLTKYLAMPQIIALTGLRRVGKTTLMKKIILDKIEEGIDPKNILYFSFDEFKTDIRQILNEHKSITETTASILLLDEIQKLPDWENKIKTIYDNQKDIKIIISGSESLFIRKRIKETLAGRIFDFRIDQLTFKEFLSFQNFNYWPINLHEQELKKLFNRFTISQGFPELVTIEDKDIIKNYIQESIIERIVYRDLPSLLNIKDISILDTIVKTIIAEPGQLIELTKFSHDLKISRQTLAIYIQYLESSFLIRKLYNYSKSRRKVERKLKKFYSPLISVDLTFKGDILSQSRVFEAILVNQLKPDFFWRDVQKNEVDIVMDNQLPIEVKYGKITTKGITAFMKKFKIKKGIILSQDKEQEIKEKDQIIKVIPAYKYLLTK